MSTIPSLTSSSSSSISASTLPTPATPGPLYIINALPLPSSSTSSSSSSSSSSSNSTPSSVQRGSENLESELLRLTEMMKNPELRARIDASAKDIDPNILRNTGRCIERIISEMNLVTECINLS